MKLNLSIMRTLENWQLAKIEQERPVAEVVAEIHETFFTEVDRLKENCGKPTPETSEIQDYLDRSMELFNLGFQMCKEVKETQEEHMRIGRIQEENKNKEAILRAINHFSFHYPNYKFITESSVQKICNKYGLIYGSAMRYIGSVPVKNMEDIKNFSIKEEDKAILIHIDPCANYKVIYERASPRNFQWEQGQRAAFFGSKSEFDAIYSEHEDKIKAEKKCISHAPYFSEPGLEIAAPASDFDKEHTKMLGSKLVNSYPDPVVLKPVIFEGKKHYLIVTAWGPEASDELVVNQKMN